MAVLTYTATDRVEPPRKGHEGIKIERATYTHNGATSLSASDLVFMQKVPTGVYILDGYLKGTCGGDATVWKVGISGGGGAESTLHAAATFSATAQLQRFNGNLPFKVSVSDDAANRFVWVYLTRTSGTSTATASLDLVITYAAIGAS